MKKEFEEIKKYLEENEDVFINIIEEFDNNDGYLNDRRFMSMEVLNDFLYKYLPNAVLLKAFNGKDLDSYNKEADEYGKFNPNRDYFRFDAYENLESSDYKDYSTFLDEYFIEKLIEEKDSLYSIKGLGDLQEILEKAI